MYIYIIFFFKQKTAYDMRISDWSSDVCSSDLPREYLAEPDKATAVREHLNKAPAPDGFSVVVVGGKALLTERQGSGGIVQPFIKKVATLDFDTVQMEIARALPNLESDPEDAVTAACSLIEAVCRSILVELKVPLPPKKDIEDRKSTRLNSSN